MPKLPRYGAIELKRNYRRFFTRALFFAVVIHLSLLGVYWLSAYLTKEKPQPKVIRINKYNELIPLIAEIEKEYAAMLSEDQKGAEWSDAVSGNNISAGSGEDSGSGSEGRQGGRTASTEVRRLAREALSREVGQKGLLGILEAAGYTIQEGGGGGSGGGGEELTREDLDKILSSAGVLNAEGGGGGGGGGAGSGEGKGLEEAKGSRSSRQANIDDVMSGERGVRTKTLSRKGELQVESPSEVGGQGVRNANRSSDAIQKVLVEHVPVIRYCYERELKRNPELKGKITVRITIAPDGSVKDAAVVASTMNDERVERCILSRVRMWKDFPAIDPNEGDVTFRQVYSFGY